MNVQPPGGGSLAVDNTPANLYPSLSNMGAEQVRVEPKRSSITAPLSSRAREILDTLKEQRESLLGRWNGSSGDKAALPEIPNSPSESSTSCSASSPERALAIQKLHASLRHERKSRLLQHHQRQRLVPSSTDTSGSVDGSETGKASVATRSTTTDDTASSTAFSSPASTSSISGGVQCASDTLFLNKSIHIPQPADESDLAKKVTVRVCSDINQETNIASSTALTDLKVTDGDSPALNVAAASDSARQQEARDVTPLSPESLSSTEEPELAHLQTISFPCLHVEASPQQSAHVVSPLLPATIVPVTPTKPRNFDATSRLTANRSGVKTSISMRDLDIPLELSPIDARQRQQLGSPRFLSNESSSHSPRSVEESTTRDVGSPETCSGQSDSSTSTITTTNSTAALSLATKKDRSAYIGQLYQYQGAGVVGAAAPGGANGGIVKRRVRSAAIRPSTGLRRHERNQINRVMVRGRVGILKPSNLRVFVTEAAAEKQLARNALRSKKEPPADNTVASLSEPIEGTAQEGLSTEGGEKLQEKRDLVNDAAKSSPFGTRELRIGNQLSTHSDDDSLSDESEDDNRRKRLELIRQLEDDIARSIAEKEQVQRSPTRSLSPSTSSSEFMVISDDSSCELTTNSDTSDWANSTTGESTLFLGNESMTDTYSIVSGVTMPPLSPLSPPIRHAKSRAKTTSLTPRRVVVAWKEPLLSEIQAPSTDEESHHEQRIESNVKSSSLSPQSTSNLFVAGRAADSLCFANGGHFLLATMSGMKLNQTMNMKLVRLNIKPTAPKTVRLSTDFRCGTRGSLYDIAVRTGCNVHDPFPFHRSRRRQPAAFAVAPSQEDTDSVQTEITSDKVYLKARGGIYDTVIHSGLTKDALHIRAPLTITTNHRSLQKAVPTMKMRSSDGVIPELISDRQCGTASSTLALLKGY